MKKIEIFVGSDSAFEKIVPKSARNLSEMAAKLDDGNKKMDVFVNIPGQPEPKSKKKKKPRVQDFVIHADEYCSVQEHVIINFINFIFQMSITNMYIQNPPKNIREQIYRTFDKSIIHETQQPYLEVSKEMIEQKIQGRYQNIYDWFVENEGQENEAGKLFDATNDIIRRITRYAAQLSEKNALGANRKEEYRKVAELFLRCQNVEEAHKMSAMVFGMECPQHLAGELIRETDSMNIGVYEEQPMEITLKPRVRTYREKSRRSAIRESAEQKQETRRKLLEQQKKETEKLRALEVDGKIYFDKLPVLEPRIREILLKWLSDAMESADFSARTDDGRRYILDRSQAGENCVVHCEDGNFTMPKLSIVFQEEV